jgi:hypothetical protein
MTAYIDMVFGTGKAKAFGSEHVLAVGSAQRLEAPYTTGKLTMVDFHS